MAVCVLTGMHDEHLGIAAVGEGAQDYLVKGQVDGVLLGRALRYAVERKRADDNARRLREVELRQAESARLERGLLPKPLMRDPSPSVRTLYRPGRHRALLGGDFFDVVQTAPDQLHVLIGDVCGHGVDEAPLGVALRVAWRALVLAGVPDGAVLPSLEEVLVSERRSDELFATVATVTIDLGARTREHAAGRPSAAAGADRAARSGSARSSPAWCSACCRASTGPATQVTLDEEWALLMYTDGLIEGWASPEGGDRLGVEGLCDMLAGATATGSPAADLPGWLVEPGRGAQRRPAGRRRRGGADQPGACVMRRVPAAALARLADHRAARPAPASS